MECIGCKAVKIKGIIVRKCGAKYETIKYPIEIESASEKEIEEFEESTFTNDSEFSELFDNDNIEMEAD